MTHPGSNVDPQTVASFGDEWAKHDQSSIDPEELAANFERYFSIFPWTSLQSGAVGFDMGCGSGRWARFVAPKVGTLNCIDPAAAALAVAQRNLAGLPNIHFHHATSEAAPLAPASQDFGYSLGVLHHIPNTEAALADCTRLLKPGAPFLVYLYYRFDNRPWWFRAIWRSSEILRAAISALPPTPKSLATDGLALFVYWPLARFAAVVERLGLPVRHLPLSFYRASSFATMRTDSRDRFGTPLEQRFTRREIERMMQTAGLCDIRFSDREPYWVAVGFKA
jgi:SAM-dependent methyltransferase